MEPHMNCPHKLNSSSHHSSHFQEYFIDRSILFRLKQDEIQIFRITSRSNLWIIFYDLFNALQVLQVVVIINSKKIDNGGFYYFNLNYKLKYI